MERVFRIASVILFVVAMGVLMLFALAFIALSLWEVLSLAVSGQPITGAMLDSVGLVIISIAIFEVARFLYEEEIVRQKELRSVRESRQTLTKFMTIIVIASSLEALVFIFEAGKEQLTDVIYPAALLGVNALLVIGLGLYQRLSREAEKPIPGTADVIPSEPEPGQDSGGPARRPQKSPVSRPSE